jgi:hypothetical protein
MNKKNRRWIILGGALVIGLAVLGRWMMQHEDADPVSPPPEAVISAPAQAQMVAAVEATSEVVLPERGAAPEVAPPSPRATVLRGRVYDEDSGAPISGAQVSFQAEEGDDRADTWSADDGSFVFENVAPGRVLVFVSAQDYGRRHLQVVVRDNTEPIEINLSIAGSISGRVVAADGTTPVAARTRLRDLARHSGSSSSTTPAGEFDWQQLNPGRYEVSAHTAEGMATREIVLAKGQRVSGIVLALTAEHSIRGGITGLRPEQLSEVSVGLFPEGGGMRGPTGRVDGSGAYVIQGVPPGRFLVVAEASGRHMARTVDMPADGDLTVNLDFPRGVLLSGRITRGGEPMSGVSIVPTPPPGVRRSVNFNETTTAADGTYVVEDVPPGDYVLMISSLANPGLTVSGDTVFDYDVPEGKLSGRLVGQDAEPIEGAVVNIWPAEAVDAHRPMPSGSDALGRFTLVGVDPGEYLLTVYKPGYEMVRKHISLGTNSADLELVLREERGVEVTAREAVSGTPVRAIEVIDNGRGSLTLYLDKDGVGYLPSALAGSTLRFMTRCCEPTVIEAWNGGRLELQLKRAGTR